MACGAVINAVWDLWARIEGKPLWEMVVVRNPLSTDPSVSALTRERSAR